MIIEKDLYGLVITAQLHKHYAHFEIFEKDNHENEGKVYELGDKHTIKDKAEIYLTGDVKWDGCSNWMFYPDQNCYIHFCRPAEAKQVAEIIEICWQWTKSNLSTWLV